MTSSLEKKAEAAAIKAKLDKESSTAAIAESADDGSHTQKIKDSKQRPSFRPAVAYEIAASAASYVHFRNKDLSTESEPQEEADDMLIYGSDDQPQFEGEWSPSRVSKSEMAAYMAASTMTAVVAAGEKEKQEAAKDLQSLHYAPCEWFVCDDSSAYTRRFVIQVIIHHASSQLHHISK